MMLSADVRNGERGWSNVDDCGQGGGVKTGFCRRPLWTTPNNYFHAVFKVQSMGLGRLIPCASKDTPNQLQNSFN